jgi:AraC-like DNA-binding protein
MTNPPEEILPPEQAEALLRIEWFKYCERGSDYHTQSHKHRHPQWYHVVRGSVLGRADGVPFELKPGQSMLFAPNSLREYCAGRRPPAYFVTVFKPAHSLNLAPLHNRILQAPPSLDADLEAIVSEARRPGQDSGLLSQALLLRLMIGLKRNFLALGPARKQPPVSSLTRTFTRSVVERMELFIKQNYHEPITRGDIAAHLSMSPGHAARLYRAGTGRTLVDRITHVRIEAAKNLLLNSTLTVTRVALETGYASFSHFSKTFKDLEGVSPGDYRRSMGMSWENQTSGSGAVRA